MREYAARRLRYGREAAEKTHGHLLDDWARCCFRAWELVQCCMRPAIAMGAIAWIGLDYAAAAEILRVYGLLCPAILDGLRLIETQALEVLNAKH